MENKTIEKVILDTEEGIAKILEDSKLPAGVMELILRNIYNQVKSLVLKQIEGGTNGSSTDVQS